jgi:hypothetical protein
MSALAQHATLDLNLHEKQTIAFESAATEILYGGAAGGGKSHLMRAAAIVWCAAIPGLQVYLFRRIRDDLVKNHMEGPKGFRAVLAGWVMCGFVKIVDDEIRFWNGSRIYLCHCKDEKDIYKYQGAEIHVLLIDELTHFTDSMYRFLRNRVRMVGLTLPPGYAGRFPRILAGANPGNVGHLWVKSTFVDHGPYDVYRAAPEEGGMMRQFIPALLEDNPSMTEDDPGYETRLQGLGSATLVQAMRYGNWDVIEGAFFDCWEPQRHIIRPFEIPAHWLRFMSGDWGSAKPFSFGWWAVASDQTTVEARDGGKKLVLPRGCMIRYREWYGAKKPNEGLKLHADAVARGIKERDGTDTVKLSYRVLDPAAFAEDGGESIAQAMSREKVSFRPADNARVAQRGAMGGWDQMRGRMVGDEDGNPMIVTFSTCHDSIRTIPALQHDKDRPEDLDSDMEDHAADEWRYGCMSRPWIRKATAVERKPSDGYRRVGGSSEQSWRV